MLISFVGYASSPPTAAPIPEFLEQPQRQVIDAASDPEIKSRADKKFWTDFDDMHSHFHGLRSLMRFCTLAYPNTINEMYLHPIADFLNENFFDDLERGWDQDGTSSDLAFTILSLVYLPYLLIISAKYAKDRKLAFKDLPARIQHAIIEAVIWIAANVAMTTLSYHPELNGNVCDLSIFGIFSVAIIFDIINTLYEQTKAIEALNNQLSQLKDRDGEDYLKYLDLNTQLFILQGKRLSTLGFGIFATSGGTCLIASNILALIGNTTEIVSHLAFAGTYCISGAALFFAIFRLTTELIAYGKEYIHVVSKIDIINKQIENAKSFNNFDEINNLEKIRRPLLQRERELKYEVVKSLSYYTCIALLLGVSLCGGPVAGLIAFSAFFLAHMAYKKLIEPTVVKHMVNLPPPPSTNTLAQQPT